AEPGRCWRECEKVRPSGRGENPILREIGARHKRHSRSLGREPRPGVGQPVSSSTRLDSVYSGRTGDSTMPRSTLALLVLFLFSFRVVAGRVGAQEAKPPTAKKDQGRIAGGVVTLAGGEPLRKARIRLESQADRTKSLSVSTDAGGRFELKALDPGSYRL